MCFTLSWENIGNNSTEYGKTQYGGGEEYSEVPCPQVGAALIHVP